MAERGADILPTTSLGHYEVRSKIGSGGMGDVFDAIHTGLNKRVAIKTLRKRFLDDEIVVQRFLREGQLASRIRHPNIVDVTDVGMMGGLPCLVMEHLEGESMSALLRREGPLAPDTIVHLLLPVIAAVHFAHEHNVVHRDLKPSNILLSRSWNGETVPKVLDFGISKLVHDSQQAALTTDSAFVGTPHYASPELMRADRQIDGRSDQYSVGVILYEAAAGIRPFADLGNNFIALAMAICNADYPPLRTRNPNVSTAYEQVVKRAMSLSASARYPSLIHLGEALLPFANARTRLIWEPTFTTGQSEVSGRTDILAQTGSSRTALIGVPSMHSSPSQSVAPHTPQALLTGPHLAYPVDPSGYMSGTPPGLDRLPSYGAGTAVPSLMRPRSSGIVTLIVGLVMGTAVLVSVVLLRGRRHVEEPQAVTTAAPPTTFSLDLQVTPASAIIEVDNVVSGTGRIVRSYPADGHNHVLRLSAPGYETVVIDFSEAAPPPPAIALRPQPPPTAAPTPTPTHVAAPPQPTQGAHRTPAPPPPATGRPKGNSDSRPKTDNIDPWQ